MGCLKIFSTRRIWWLQFTPSRPKKLKTCANLPQKKILILLPIYMSVQFQMQTWKLLWKLKDNNMNLILLRNWRNKSMGKRRTRLSKTPKRTSRYSWTKSLRWLSPKMKRVFSRQRMRQRQTLIDWKKRWRVQPKISLVTLNFQQKRSNWKAIYKTEQFFSNLSLLKNCNCWKTIWSTRHVFLTPRTSFNHF